MNSSEVAAAIGTDPRTLRAFLRSPSSTFRAVGSGARYEFTEADLPTLRKRFAEWAGAGKPKAVTPNKRKAVRQRMSAEDKRLKRDREVWDEEGPVVLEDIRDPQVRRRVLADARAAEDRLMMKLLAKGMHVTQKGDSSCVA